ncbi:MAG: ABC transporter ATP-binding protein, partial [Lachnospiraceae bacterium]|nr:ABC transporter ATP-binding protein [Lachnospiraceae bacterium]
GKTTLFKLLERMYQPTSGRICYGDRNIEDYCLEDWRRVFSIVSQDNMVMSGSIRENICCGVIRNVSEKELRTVAERANVYAFAAGTPDGFDTEMGPDGCNFSGGQRQCVAIARAMMRNPDYLLLDESTSNLDIKSERTVTEALANLMKGKTTVLIAHNYAAAKMADYIIILKDGEIEACGTPEEVKDNPYFQVFSKRGI